MNPEEERAKELTWSDMEGYVEGDGVAECSILKRISYRPGSSSARDPASPSSQPANPSCQSIHPLRQPLRQLLLRTFQSWHGPACDSDELFETVLQIERGLLLL